MKRPPTGWVPAKIGTIPMTVKFDRRTGFREGCRVRWIEAKNGKVMTGILNNIAPVRVERF